MGSAVCAFQPKKTGNSSRKKNSHSVQACSVETIPEHLCACGLPAFEEVLYFPGKCKVRRCRYLCVLQITFTHPRELWAVSGPRNEADVSTYKDGFIVSHLRVLSSTGKVFIYHTTQITLTKALQLRNEGLSLSTCVSQAPESNF